MSAPTKFYNASRIEIETGILSFLLCVYVDINNVDVILYGQTLTHIILIIYVAQTDFLSLLDTLEVLVMLWCHTFLNSLCRH